MLFRDSGYLPFAPDYAIMAFMKKLFYAALLSTLLFAATPEQVEKYLSVTYAEEQLLELEKQFSMMQSNFSQNDENTASTYDISKHQR